MLLRVGETLRATHRELVHLRPTVFLATRAWCSLEDVWNATWARVERFRITDRWSFWLRKAWGSHSDFRLLDRVLEEEAADVGGDVLLGLDRRRGRCK